MDMGQGALHGAFCLPAQDAKPVDHPVPNSTVLPEGLTVAKTLCPFQSSELHFPYCV